MRAVILFSFILSVMLFGCNNAENEIFILPKEHRGYVLVIFNQKNGGTSKYNGEKRVYEIPQNGILKTQFKPNDGLTDFPQFYYETAIQSNQIPFKAEFKNVPTDTVVAYGGTSGSIKKSAESQERIFIVKFYVGTKSDIEKAQEQAEKLDIVKLAEQ